MNWLIVQLISDINSVHWFIWNQYVYKISNYKFSIRMNMFTFSFYSYVTESTYEVAKIVMGLFIVPMKPL